MPERPEVAGESAADRLMRSLDYRLTPEAPRLTREQVAVVAHALADHTALAAAIEYRHDPESTWPVVTSLGRWFHALADDLEREAHPCGHVETVWGCGGCDPGAIEAVYDDTGRRWRLFDPAQDLRAPVVRLRWEAGQHARFSAAAADSTIGQVVKVDGRPHRVMGAAVVDEGRAIVTEVMPIASGDAPGS